MKVSVLLCTHNPRRDFLARVLAALSVQTLPSSDWNLIVVDNASSPPLTGADLPTMPVPLQLLVEPKLGSLHARLCALRASSGSILVIVDDDNVLHCDYLANACAFLAAHPEVGAVGGCVEPEFETPPPPWLGPHHNLLALRNFGPAPVISNWKEHPKDYPWCAPFGAGMALRRDCAQHYLARIKDARFVSVGRQGTSFLGGCEDAEIILYGVLQGGREVAYSPELQLTHLIPARRLQYAYLSRLAYQTGLTWGQFCVRHGFWNPVPRWTVPVRAALQFLRNQGWTRKGRLSWRSAHGRTAGRIAP